MIFLHDDAIRFSGPLDERHGGGGVDGRGEHLSCRGWGDGARDGWANFVVAGKS